MVLTTQFYRLTSWAAGGLAICELIGWLLTGSAQIDLLILRIAELIWLTVMIIIFNQRVTLGFVVPSRKHVLFLIAVAASSCVAASVLKWLNLLNQWSALPVTSDIIGMLLMLAVAPVVEEIIFRGLFYRMLHEIFDHKWLAIIISSACFAISHGSLLSPQLIGGLIFTCVYARTGNLWLPIILHIGANGMLIFYINN